MLHKTSRLDPAVANDLALRWQKDRDEGARDQLLGDFMPFIRATASRWAGQWKVNRDDAVSEAMIGFVQALDTYNPMLGSLVTHAGWRIKANISRARHAEFALTLPSYVFSDTGKIARASVKLRRQLGRAATLEEIAAECGLSATRVASASGALSIRPAWSA